MSTTSTGWRAANIFTLASQAYEATINAPERLVMLTELSARVDYLMDFVYGYTVINDENLDTDDEIINWTFVDVADDLSAAHWNIASGFYKAGASSLRNALDISMASLYFQIRANDPQSDGSKYFAKWDRGDRDTPNWGEMKPIINQHFSIVKFNNAYSCDIFGEIYAHFKYLCNFTHSRPFAPTDSTPTNSINLGSHIAEFHVDNFNRFVDMSKLTLAWIATLWLIAYPDILQSSSLQEPDKRNALLCFQRGIEAIEFASK